MSRGLSVYLDVLRFLAALEVFLSHAARFPFTGIRPAWWNAFGHEAVILFFVLSGFVICHAATGEDRRPGRFFVDRVSRIYSVALPALALTLLLDMIGRAAAPEIYDGIAAHNRLAERLLVSALLVNESWGLEVQALSNTPYWSISYEIWYYFIFGSAVFFRGAVRWVAVTLFCLIAGPKVLLLLPVWLLGSWAYRETRSAAWSPVTIRAAFVAVVPVVVLFDHFDIARFGNEVLIAMLGEAAWRQLGWSRHVLSDTLLAAVVALHFVAAKRLAAQSPPMILFAEPLARSLSRYTFTLYLIHQPVLLFVGACLGPVVPVAVMPFVLLSGMAVAVVAFGSVTEGQRHRLTGPLMRLAGTRIDRLAARV
jgi:peptidoglycan/LPS O-acetylase OafA/YrhL